MAKLSSGYAIAKLQARMDAEELFAEREDALQCKPGNKACGKRCIPQAQKCKAEGGGAYNSKAGKIARTAVGVGVGAAALLAYRNSKQAGAKGLAGTPPNRPALPPSRRDSSLSDRLNSFVREDAPKCNPGNKPCGKRCIPEKQNCAVETAKGALAGGAVGGTLGYAFTGPLGAAVGGASGLVSGALKARGHSDLTAKIAGSIAGVAGGAALLGVAAKTRFNYTTDKGLGGDDKQKYNERRAQEKAQEQATNEAYKTLGVKKGASPEEVQKAYKAAARKFHPDLNKDPQAGKKFADINAAMDILDPKRKAKADESQAENAKREAEGAKRAGVRFNSLQARLDSVMFLRLQEAYKTIQQDFPDVSPDFWYSR